MKWKEITKGYKFEDGSIVTQKHQTHMYDCYEIEYNTKKIVLSKDHIIQINIKNLHKNAQDEIRCMCNGQIPITENLHIQVLGNINDHEQNQIGMWLKGEVIDIKVDDLSENSIECYIFHFPSRQFGVEVFVKREPTSWENQKIDDDNYWVPIGGIAYLFGKYGSLDIGYTTIDKVIFRGKLPCFCVSTNTGQYKLNGLKNHNSVMIQNIILHSLEHNNKIKIGLVDPKMVEFSNYKGMNGVVGVANSTLEAVELLRVARQVMKKRNVEMQKLGIKSLTDYKPTKKTNKVFITGREYNENDSINVRINGEEKTMLASELVDYLQNM